MSDGRVDYSIVIPVYFNEGCLLPLFRALATEVLQANPGRKGEIVFVDDGSKDRSFDELRQIASDSPSNVTIVKLTRNFGQTAAILAGYDHARGDCVVTISADGQEPTSLVNEMLKAFFEEHYEIVICPRAGREESAYRALGSGLYFSLMRLLTFSHMPRGGFDAWLMGRRALQVFLRNPDASPSFQWRLLWMGFETKSVSYRRRARLAGRSRYNFPRKLNAVLDGILGHSLAPIRLMWLSGCVLSLLGAAYAVWLLLGSLLRESPVTPAALVIVALLFTAGLQMIVSGILGEYVWRTLKQVRDRDMYVIDAVYPAGVAAGHARPSSAAGTA